MKPELDKAIESDIATGIAGLWENAWMDPDCRPGPDDVANAVVELIRTDIAPHIESALLDRIEEEIGKLVHEPNRDENGDQSYGYGLGLNAALAVLSQIRQEGKP